MTRTILLVEDSADEAELAEIALARSKTAHQLVVVSDGRAALEHLRTERRTPDLVLLDLKLPDLSGFEVLAAIRRDPKTAFVPVVILSSSDEPDDVLGSYRAGANSYVRKPVDFEEFSDVVNRLGDYWLFVNQRPARDEP